MTSLDALIRTHDLTRVFEIRRTPRRLWRASRSPIRSSSPNIRVAVDRVSISVHAGEIYGLLGPNGAGKTTTLRMLGTLLKPTDGSAEICGYDINYDSASVRRHIGVLFAGERGIYWRLTARENLVLFGRLELMSRKMIQQRSSYLLDRLGLADRSNDLVESFSTGMKQSLNLARTVLHDPPVLLLDEPTASLDPSASRHTREFVKELTKEGKAILLATHNMFEADELCDRVGIINDGQLVAEGRPSELIAQAGVEPRVELRIEGAIEPAQVALRAMDLWCNPKNQGANSEFAVRAPYGWESVRQISHLLEQAGVRVLESRLREATLEDAFVHLTGDRLRDPFV